MMNPVFYFSNLQTLHFVSKFLYEYKYEKRKVFYVLGLK